MEMNKMEYMCLCYVFYPSQNYEQFIMALNELDDPVGTLDTSFDYLYIGADTKPFWDLVEEYDRKP